jgi:hypothetical protein
VVRVRTSSSTEEGIDIMRGGVFVGGRIGCGVEGWIAGEVCEDDEAGENENQSLFSGEDGMGRAVERPR